MLGCLSSMLDCTEVYILQEVCKVKIWFSAIIYTSDSAAYW